MITSHAPGRVELLGNHTDYNDGVVLSAAIGFGVTMQGATRNDGIIRLASSTLDVALEVPSETFVKQTEADWANYPLGVVEVFRKAGFPVGAFEADVTSNLPLGAGLSSSAALEVATARLLEKMFAWEITPLELAKLCKKAENEFAGVNCGLLDQVSSVFGKRDHAIFLDCRAESVENIRFPKGVVLIVTHSGVKHALVGGEYNERREQCFAAARILGVPALRDANSALLETHRDRLTDLQYRRAKHVVGENERVFAGIDFLRSGDAAGFGALMFDSHESSIHNFENSTPELDALVAIARDTRGVFGSRLTGGGFGGATVSLVAKEEAETIRTAFTEAYAKRTGHHCQTYLCEIADGAA